MMVSKPLQTREVLPDSHPKLGIFPVQANAGRNPGAGRFYLDTTPRPGQPQNKRLLSKTVGTATEVCAPGCRLDLGARSCPCCMASAGKPHQEPHKRGPLECWAHPRSQPDL